MTRHLVPAQAKAGGVTEDERCQLEARARRDAGCRAALAKLREDVEAA